MPASTNKSILITPGSYSSLTTSVSQIDLKWYESGIGTFVFVPNSGDLRSTIYNWQQNSEPVILFGGIGTYNSQRKFVGPYQDFSGSFTGITSFPYIQFYPLSGTINANTINVTGVASFTQIYVNGLSTIGSLYLPGPFYDNSFSPGTLGQLLQSTGSGIAWTSVNTTGIITASGGIPNRVTKFLDEDTIGNSTITDTGTAVSIGVGLTVNGAVTSFGFYGPGTFITNLNASNLASGTVPSGRVTGSYSGITSVGNLDLLYVIGVATASAFFGNGANLSNLNASNLTSGTVPSARVTGNYSGITSVGTLSQLIVSGFSTVNTIRISGSLYDSNFSPGLNNQFLISTGAGIAWTTVSATGILTGSGTLNTVAKFGSPNSLVDSKITDTGSVVTIGVGLSVSGFSSSFGFYGPGTFITNLNASNLASGTVPSGRVIGNYSGITSVGTLTQLITSGFATASGFFGPGTFITNLNASNLASGTIPSDRVTGNYSGITSVGSLSQLIVTGFSTINNIRISGSLYDGSFNPGLTNQILISTGSGIAWTTSTSTGILTGAGTINTIPKFNTANSLTNSNIFDNGSVISIGVGVSVLGFTSSAGFYGPGTFITNLNASNLASGTVPSAVVTGSYSGITSVGTLTQLITSGFATASGFFGPGTFVTNLNASNLASGTVPSAVVSGTYSGITSVGTLTQLIVSGFSTINNIRISGALYDSSFRPGSVNQVLISTGAGISWTTATATGILTGSGTINTVPKFNTANSLTNSNITDSGTQIVLGSASSISGILTSFGYFGPGTNITNLNASNLASGTVPSAVVTGSYSGITSVGTLTQLITSGFATASGFFGPGTFITNLNASNLASGTVPSAVVSGAYSGITSVGTLTQLITSGFATASGFFGPGTFITNLNASNLASGTVPSAVVTGSYSGITSVGALTQLIVSGFSTINNIRINGSLYDGSFSPGLLNQILISTGAGISWTSATATGILTGSGTINTLSKFSSASSLVDSNVSDNGTIVNINSILNVTGISTFAKDITINGITAGIGPGTSLTNTSFGSSANLSNISGRDNVAIGYQALLSNKQGALNIAIGANALRELDGGFANGSGNIGIGFSALGLHTSGAFNVAVGHLAMAGDRDGVANVAIGPAALWFNSSGRFNIGIGFQAGAYTDVGDGNVAIGYFALRNYNGIGSQIAIGFNALQGNTANRFINTGGFNLAIGYQAGFGNTSGSNNLFIGYRAGLANTIGSNNIYFGNRTNGDTSGNYQIGIGNDITIGSSNLGAWGGNTNSTRTNLGIGTFTSLARLHVETLAAGNMGLYIAGSPSQTGDLVEVNATTNGQNYFTITGIGSVGIYTSVPLYALDINGDARLRGRLFDSRNSAGSQNQLLISTGVGISWTSTTATGIVTGTGVATRIAYFADPNTLTSNSNFIIDSVGNFGISTNIPRQRFDVFATARFSGPALFYGSTSNDAFSLSQQFDTTYQGTNNVLRFRQGGSTAGAVAFSFYDDLPAIFMTYNAANSPRVGIGTTGPLQTLHVGGNALISGFTTSSGYFGPGTNLTNLNASNLITGTVPSAVVSGAYSGITSVGSLSQLIVSGFSTINNIRINGALYDGSFSPGSVNQVLISTGSGIAWTTSTSTGILTGSGTINTVPKFNTANSLTNSNITDSGTQIVLGSASSISGIVTSFGYFGPGTNLTNLNASNLASGTVPSAVVSGSYSGITSVGTQSQLIVSGFSTLSNVRITGALYDGSFSPGTTSQILISTGAGISWTSATATGIVTGSGSASQVTYWAGTSRVTGNNLFVYNGIGSVGIGTNIPEYALHVVGTMAATIKSFIIDHPTQSGRKLRYASLEGPENGVYVRGRSSDPIIILPNYWTGLVDEDTITVNITPVGKYQNIYVEKIVDYVVYVKCNSMLCTHLDYFYTVYGERKDVSKLEVEI